MKAALVAMHEEFTYATQAQNTHGNGCTIRSPIQKHVSDHPDSDLQVEAQGEAVSCMIA